MNQEAKRIKRHVILQRYLSPQKLTYNVFFLKTYVVFIQKNMVFNLQHGTLKRKEHSHKAF